MSIRDNDSSPDFQDGNSNSASGASGGSGTELKNSNQPGLSASSPRNITRNPKKNRNTARKSSVNRKGNEQATQEETGAASVSQTSEQQQKPSAPVWAVAKRLDQTWPLRMKLIEFVQKDMEKRGLTYDWPQIVAGVFDQFSKHANPEDIEFCQGALFMQPHEANAKWLNGALNRQNYSSLIFIFANHSNSDLRAIHGSYNNAYGKSQPLMKRIEGENKLDKAFREALVRLFQVEPQSENSKSAEDYVEGISSEDKTVLLNTMMELFCLQTYQTIKDVAEQYKMRNKTELRDDITKQVSAKHKHLASLYLGILQRAEHENYISPLLQQAVAALDKDMIMLPIVLLHALDYAMDYKVNLAIGEADLFQCLNRKYKEDAARFEQYCSFISCLCLGWFIDGSKQSVRDNEITIISDKHSA